MPAPIEQILIEHQVALEQVRSLIPLIEKCADRIIAALQSGKTVYLCGNGGSAADAQHLAAEFTGRFVRERKGLRAIALTTDTSAITAIGNDYGMSKIFVRQLEALALPGDILIAISTSGHSPNVLEAAQWARHNQVAVISLTGRDGGRLNSLADLPLNIGMDATARIQEMHILIGHILCELVDRAFTA